MAESVMIKDIPRFKGGEDEYDSWRRHISAYLLQFDIDIETKVVAAPVQTRALWDWCRSPERMQQSDSANSTRRLYDDTAQYGACGSTDEGSEK